jgi:cellulose synthase operon protein C
MSCSTLQAFLEGDLAPELQARFEDHLAGCAACQEEVEATMRFYALGAQLSLRRDRPHAVIPAPQEVGRPAHEVRHRQPGRQPERQPGRPGRPGLAWRRPLLAGVTFAAAAIAVALLIPPRPTASARLASQIGAELSPSRAFEERLPFAAFDQYRAYDTNRAGAAHREPLSGKTLRDLEALPDQVGLIAAHLARGELDAADEALRRAAPGDDLDVERAFVAARQGHPAGALALLDRVLARTPRHAQALWNRAVVLGELDLSLVAAEAFDASFTASFAAVQPRWSVEAFQRRAALRSREAARKQDWKTTHEACVALERGVVPDLGIVRRRPWVCRPGLYEAVRRAQTREEVMRLLPVADVIDAESGDTASSELVKRTASLDFQLRGASVAIYRKLAIPPAPSAEAKAGFVAQLRASGQADLVLGALPRAGMLHDHLDEYVALARARHDPYFAEIAVQFDAQAKQDAGRSLEAELSLRDAVAECAKREVELRCVYLQMALANQYLTRHLPAEATKVAVAGLERSRRLGLYWADRLLFAILADAARLERDYPQMRAYLREAALRDDECPQQRLSHEAMSDAELTELRFAGARAELDRAPACGEPLTLLRARIEATLAHVDGTPERVAGLREDFARARRDATWTPGERAYLDASEGRLVAAGDPAAARGLLARAIAAADQLGIGDATATKARSVAYNTLLVLGAKDLDSAALLAVFAAAGRVPPRAGCALGALIDGERLLLVARDAGDRFQQVFEPNAFQTPDVDARTLVPAAILRALSGCPRVDVIALPPLYGQPHLLPPELAWSYRGPATAQLPGGTRRPVALTIEDTRPPAALGLARLQSASHEPRATSVDDVIVSGGEATPRRVLQELALADFVEIHAHGFVDLGISDASLIALSPQSDGSFALTARAIAAVKLERAPFIALAACHAAYTAPYLHEPWSLPYAFLLAGARGVLAPTTAIPDKDAGSFFRAVGDQILRGADPAAVLRDQRQQRRSPDWVNDVVLFD